MRCEGVPKKLPPLLEVQYGSKPDFLLKRVYLAFAEKALHVRPRGHCHDTLWLDLQRRGQIRQGVLLVACMRCRFAQRRRVRRKVGGSSGSEQLDGISIKLLEWQLKPGRHRFEQRHLGNATAQPGSTVVVSMVRCSRAMMSSRCLQSEDDGYAGLDGKDFKQSTVPHLHLSRPLPEGC